MVCWKYHLRADVCMSPRQDCHPGFLSPRAAKTSLSALYSYGPVDAHLIKSNISICWNTIRKMFLKATNVLFHSAHIYVQQWKTSILCASSIISVSLTTLATCNGIGDQFFGRPLRLRYVPYKSPQSVPRSEPVEIAIVPVSLESSSLFETCSIKIISNSN